MKRPKRTPNVPDREQARRNKQGATGVFPSGNIELSQKVDSRVEQAARESALRFGKLIRERREALDMRQDDLALAAGVGRRFVIDLEAGKPRCQLGKSLVVAIAVGLHPFDPTSAEDNALLPDLPDIESKHGR